MFRKSVFVLSYNIRQGFPWKANRFLFESTRISYARRRHEVVFVKFCKIGEPFRSLFGLVGRQADVARLCLS